MDEFEVAQQLTLRSLAMECMLSVKVNEKDSLLSNLRSN